MQEYFLVDLESIYVEIYQGVESRMWLYSVYSEGEDFICSNIEFNCSVDCLYEDVSFEIEQ